MVGPGITNASVANRRGGYTVQARAISIGDSRCPDVVDFGVIEPSSGSNRGRDRYRKYVSWLVAGGRYEFYSHYALQIQAVAASIPQRDDVLRSSDRS
jgi:hypothetical protein